jgi:hypothetical protein
MNHPLTATLITQRLPTMHQRVHDARIAPELHTHCHRNLHFVQFPVEEDLALEDCGAELADAKFVVLGVVGAVAFVHVGGDAFLNGGFVLGDHAGGEGGGAYEVEEALGVVSWLLRRFVADCAIDWIRMSAVCFCVTSKAALQADQL